MPRSIFPDPPLLFALGIARDFARRLAAHLGLPLAAHEEREFEDGEHKIRSLVSVRDRDVYVIDALYADEREGVDRKLCRLLFFVGALRDAGAARLTVVAPYLCYGRKDQRTKSRDPITTRYLAQLFEAVGTDCMITFEHHNIAAFQNAFRCRTEHLHADGPLAAHMAGLLEDAPTAVVSPDAGGMKRAERFRERLEIRLGRPVSRGIVEKYRSEGVLSGDYFAGDIVGRDVVVVDDLVSTGSTLVRAAVACRAHGARRTFALVTHGLFMGGAPALLAEPAIDRIVVTDTVPPFRLDPAATAEHRVDVVSVAGLLAEAIGRCHAGGSIVDLLDADTAS